MSLMMTLSVIALAVSVLALCCAPFAGRSDGAVIATLGLLVLYGMVQVPLFILICQLLAYPLEADPDDFSGALAALAASGVIAVLAVYLAAYPAAYPQEKS